MLPLVTVLFFKQLEPSVIEKFFFLENILKWMSTDVFFLTEKYV